MKRSTKAIGITSFVGVFLIVSVLYLRYRQQTFRTFIDRASKVSVKFPSDWTIKKGYGGAVVVFASPLDNALDTAYENVSVVVQDISTEPMSLGEYSDVAIKQMEGTFEKNFILEESTAVATLAGQPAYKIIFTGKGPEVELKYYFTWTVIDKVTVYQVVYAAIPSQFDKYYPIVEKMLASFKILK